jgi:hypothetical protein
MLKNVCPTKLIHHQSPASQCAIGQVCAIVRFEVFFEGARRWARSARFVSLTVIPGWIDS